AIRQSGFFGFVTTKILNRFLAIYAVAYAITYMVFYIFGGKEAATGKLANRIYTALLFIVGILSLSISKIITG
ncbi:MAG: hypothetical protein Q8Q54_13025, partial [Methylococcales bacterium]|nr:hypothetical protein [Methylococcales bacterium]